MTKTLILMRHAKSSWATPDMDDHKRPLNDRGVISARLLGDWLRANDYLPDEILCSSAVRTQQTCDGLNLDIAPRIMDSLYHAGIETMLSSLRKAKGDTVLMIGHNPGIAGFAEMILSDPVDHPRFDDYPTGATLVADFPDNFWASVTFGSGEAADFTVPRELMGETG